MEVLWVGMVVGVLFTIPLWLFFQAEDLSHYIDIASIIIQVFLAFFLAFIIQNNVNDRRSLKDYFVKEVSDAKKSYSGFLDEIRDGKLSSKEINTRFKQYSMSFNQLGYFLKSEMDIQTNQIQKQNREIHKIVTNSLEFNNQFSENEVNLEQREIKDMSDQFKSFTHACTDTIVQINKN